MKYEISYLSSIRELIPEELWPKDELSGERNDVTSILNNIYFTNYRILLSNEGVGFDATIAIINEISFCLLGLDNIFFVFGNSNQNSILCFNSSFFIFEKNFLLKLNEIEFGLRFSNSILKPVLSQNNETGRFSYSEINLKGNLTIDHNFDIKIDGFDKVSLLPVMIGDTGIIISADEIKFDFSKTSTIPEVIAAGFGEDFIGIFIRRAKILFPEELSSILPKEIYIENAAIGSGGFSGKIDLSFTPTFDKSTKQFSGEGGGDLWGVSIGLTNILIEFRQNALIQSDINGQIFLPYFDQILDVEIGFGLDGNISMALKNDNGLTSITKEGLFNFAVSSMELEVENGVFIAKISGDFTPLCLDLDWPTFQIRELSIDSNGNVKLEGGWIDLPEQYSFDFYGFQMEITKLGFGSTDDGGKWVGFSGGIKLVEGMPAGASVEGLRIIWYDDDRDTQITFNGIGVEFEVPDVFAFKGLVAYDDAIKRFDGAIKLQLKAMDMEIDGQFVVGLDNGQSYFAIYLGVELPAGIPLWATGLALYGMAGLFAYKMEPGKQLDEEWYGMGDGNGWYKRDPIGATALTKWKYGPDSLGFGAGVTIGTIYDNGYTFSGRMLLAIVFPGPILLIEGKANILQKRSSLSDDPMFRALAVLDGRAGTFLIGMDARYKYGSDGELIEIGGSAEAYFNLSNPSAWHLYMGQKEPKSKRISAEVLSIFKSESYFMLDAHQLAMGVWAGYDADWKFGPLRVWIEAWISGDAIISWSPPHFYGALQLHGGAGLSVFGFGVDLSVNADFAVDVFDPFHVLARFSVGIGLPWPLPDFEEDITLEWGPELDFPALPLPLREVAVEHFKVTSSWPLARKFNLLLPNHDRGDGYMPTEYLNVAPAPSPDISKKELEELLKSIPVVPMDCRPHLTFSRPVHDPTNIGENPQPVVPDYERIGDPSKNEGPVRVKYSLEKIELKKWLPEKNTWKCVASSTEDEKSSGIKKLYGTWAPIPGSNESVANVKLWLWSKTPFDYTRHSGRAWDEWFTEKFPGYPCIPPAPEREKCYDFEDLPLGIFWPTDVLTTEPEGTEYSGWRYPNESQLNFGAVPPNYFSVVPLNPPVLGYSKGLKFVDKNGNGAAIIQFPLPNKGVNLVHFIYGVGDAYAIDENGKPYGPYKINYYDSPVFEIKEENIKYLSIRITADSRITIAKVCITLPPEAAEAAAREEMAEILQDSLERWKNEGDVLEPNTIYELKIETSVHAIGEHSMSGIVKHIPLTEYAYFRTQGPPGLAKLSIPAGSDTDSSGLDDLSRYVLQTIPETVPKPGESPILPKPVYRAYDVNVEFDPDCPYIDLMYHLAHRNLGLYLFDNNDNPVRDAKGTIVRMNNLWDVSNELQLSESEARYVALFDVHTCAEISKELIPHNKILKAAKRGQTLEADTLYEARLQPMLYHEDFDSRFIEEASANRKKIGRWNPKDEEIGSTKSDWRLRGHQTLLGEKATVKGTILQLDENVDLSAIDIAIDVLVLKSDTARQNKTYKILAIDAILKQITVDGNPKLNGGVSEWEIPGWGAVVQLSSIYGGTRYGGDPVKPGTILLLEKDINLDTNHQDQPQKWTNYRFSVTVRSQNANSAIGVVFHCSDDIKDFYRFSMDGERSYRRLVKVQNGQHTILNQDDIKYKKGTDYRITIEALEACIKVFVDEELIFNVIQPPSPINSGTIGLYCWNNDSARFTDIWVDDLRKEAVVVYRFPFTTSRFANFFHHIHSYQDETWITDLGLNESVPTADFIKSNIAKAKPLEKASELPGDEEMRAYDALCEKVSMSSCVSEPIDLQITRVNHGEDALFWLIRSPEPIKWPRFEAELLFAQTNRAVQSNIPGDLKITDVSFSEENPITESVTLLLRGKIDISGYKVQCRKFLGVVSESLEDNTLFEDQFEFSDRVYEYKEDFTSLACYEIIDEAGAQGSSKWTVKENYFIQEGNIGGGEYNSDPYKPGTLAIEKYHEWQNVLITASLSCKGTGGAGIIFNYRDIKNYYRFYYVKRIKIAQLVKVVDGVHSVLWGRSYNCQELYTISIYVFEGNLMGFIGGKLEFNIYDSAQMGGRVGFYCWKNKGATFDNLFISALKSNPLLWQSKFIDLSELQIVDEQGTVEGPSEWVADNGILAQTSKINGSEPFPEMVGTFAKVGNMSWRDYSIDLRMDSEEMNGSIGVMFRMTPQPGFSENSDKCEYNFYKYSIDKKEVSGKSVFVQRLIKKIGNEIVILFEKSDDYCSQDVQLVVVNNRIFLSNGWFTNKDVYDGELETGGIALCCSNTGNAKFEKVLILDLAKSVGTWAIYQDQDNINRITSWYSQKSEMHLGKKIIYGNPDLRVGSFVLNGNIDWTDYSYSATLYGEGGEPIGLVFRFLNGDNYYSLSFDAKNKTQKLIRKAKGEITVLWEKSKSNIPITPISIQIDVVGRKIKGYLDSVLLFEIVDSSSLWVPSGKIGLYSTSNQDAHFKSVKVTRPPLGAFALFRDAFPSGNLRAWKFIDEGNLNKPSVWKIIDGKLNQQKKVHDTNPGIGKKGTNAVAGNAAWSNYIFFSRLNTTKNIEGAIGVLFRYKDQSNYYRFSVCYKEKYRRLVKCTNGKFSTLWEDNLIASESKPIHELAVKVDSSFIEIYLDEFPLCFVEDHDHENGQIGLYCWKNNTAKFWNIYILPIEKAFSAWAYKDSFDALIPQTWSFIDEVPMEIQSNWEIKEGRLIQTKETGGGSADVTAPEKPGTYAILEKLYQNFRMSVKIIPPESTGKKIPGGITPISELIPTIGVTFRYQDENNYYRYSIYHHLKFNNYQRLVKKVNGKIEVLWEGKILYSFKKSLMISIDCVGSSIRGYLNGEQQFYVNDTEWQSGKIGLYCWKNPSACFDEVRVSEPQWVHYYSFGKEVSLPAGSVIKISSGNLLNDSSLPLSNEEKRYISKGQDTGNLHFPFQQTDFRICNKDGITEHTKEFLSPNSYKKTNANIIRKRDRTGFLLTILNNSAYGMNLIEGLYRLKLVFNRDVTKTCEGSSRYSQAGDIGPEIVVIDIPWEETSK